MARRTHPKPEIEAALKYAEQNGWRIELGGSHAWGKLYCPYNNKDVGVGFFVYLVFGVPQKAQRIMLNRFVG